MQIEFGPNATKMYDAAYQIVTNIKKNKIINSVVLSYLFHPPWGGRGG